MHYAEETGMEKGMKKGMKKGEESKTKEVAIKMLRKRIDEVMIAEVTNLTLEEIEKLRNEVEYELKQ